MSRYLVAKNKIAAVNLSASSHGHRALICGFILLVASVVSAHAQTALSGAPNLPGDGTAEVLSGTTTVTMTPTNDVNTAVEYYAATFNSGPNTLANLPLWSNSAVSGEAALGVNFIWDTTAEDQGERAVGDAGTATVLFTFSSTVQDPIIHIDRLGGNGSIGSANFHSNSSIWTLTTPGLVMTRLSGNQQFRVEGNQFYRTPDVYIGTDNSNNYWEVNPNNDLTDGIGNGGGTIQIIGAVDSLEFQVSAVGIEGTASDGVDFIFETPTSPPVEEVDLDIVKSRDYSAVPVGYPVTFTLQYNCISTIAGGQAATITDSIDPFMTVTGLINSAHIASSSFNPVTNMVTFEFVDPLPAGSTGEVKIITEFLSAVTDGYTATNVATIDADNGLAEVSNQVSVSANSGLPAYEKGVSVEKWSSSSDLSHAMEVMEYDIRHGNTGGLGQDIDNYEIVDIFPTELKLEAFNVGEFPGTSQTVDVFYQTNMNAAWQLWGTWNTDNDDADTNQSALGLAATEWVTGLKFDFGTVPGGAGFHPEQNGAETIDIKLVAVDYHALVVGSVFTNCAVLTGSDAGGGGTTYNEQDCVSTTVDAPEPEYEFWFYDSTSGPYDPGETITQRVYIAVNDDSGFPLVDPILACLLPDGFTFAGNVVPSLTSTYSDLGSPALNYTVTPDYAGTGRELVRIWYVGGDHSSR